MALQRVTEVKEKVKWAREECGLSLSNQHLKRDFPAMSHFRTQNMTTNADGFTNTRDYIPEMLPRGRTRLRVCAFLKKQKGQKPGELSNQSKA